MKKLPKIKAAKLSVKNNSGAKTIDGKYLSENILREIYQEIKKNQLQLSLAAILVGDDPASRLYVNLKKKACEQCGIMFNNYYLSASATEQQVIDAIEFLNQDPAITGILVQLPLPKKFNESKIMATIKPEKDVDGFHPFNLACLEQGAPTIIPGLALGIMIMIKSTGVNLEGKNAVIVCNSPIFSLPLKYLLAEEKITAYDYRPQNKNLLNELKTADIIIVAVGKEKFIAKEMIKPGAIIIDVGINKTKSGETVGDVDPECAETAGFISPVPGGVGPMTVAMLLWNLILLAKK